jgi:hypothetical protein
MDLNYKSAELDKIYEILARFIAKVEAPAPKESEYEPIYHEMKRWHNSVQKDLI